MKKYLTLLILISCLGAISCTSSTSGAAAATPGCDYFNTGDTGLQTAGIKLIPIETPV